MVRNLRILLLCILDLFGPHSHLATEGIDLLWHTANGEISRHAVDDRSLEAQVDEGLVDSLLLQLLRHIACHLLHGRRHIDELTRVSADRMAIVAVYTFLVSPKPFMQLFF